MCTPESALKAITTIRCPCLCMYLNFVGELFDLIDGGIIFIGELPELLLAPFRHLLQVGALVLCVTERPLQASSKDKVMIEAKSKIIDLH